MNARRFSFPAMAILLLFLALELFSYLLLPFAGALVGEPFSRTSTIYQQQSEKIKRALVLAGNARDQVDPLLGWHYKSGYSGAGEHISQQGVRSKKIYSITPPDGILRVAAFGDSFVYGIEANDQQTWSHVLEQSNDRIELLNYGVGGYGTDQALLRYQKEGANLNPHIAILSFTPVDMRRNVNVYRRFLGARESLAVKPRFVLTGMPDQPLEYLAPPIKSLEDWRDLLENPSQILNWGTHDQFYQPLIYNNPLYNWSALVRLTSNIWLRIKQRAFNPDRIFIARDFNTSSEAFLIQLEIYRSFIALARKRGHIPVLLMLPGQANTQRAASGEENALDTLSKAIRKQVSADVLILDASDAFHKAVGNKPVAPYFASGGHYSPPGNSIVGHWLARELKTHFLKP